MANFNKRTPLQASFNRGWRLGERSVAGSPEAANIRSRIGKKLRFFNSRFAILFAIFILCACFWGLLLKTSLVMFVISIFVPGCMLGLIANTRVGEPSQAAGESSHLQSTGAAIENNATKLRETGETMAQQN